MPCRERLRWFVLPMILGIVASPLAVDYWTLNRLHESSRALRVGMTPKEVRNVIGPPHSTSCGWFGLASPGQQLTDTTWSYQTMFDWDGRRGISSHDPRPYWWTRLSPEREHYDEVLTVWFRGGRLIGVTIPWEGTVVE